MRPRKTLSMYVLLVGVMGLSIVGGILAFQIFSAAVKSQATPEQTAAIKPIDGSISKDVVNNLSKRTAVSESSLLDLDLITPTLIPTVTPTESIVASASATTGL